MIELEKCECVSSIMTIAPVLKIDIEKMGAMGILLIIYDGVYVCICNVYSSVLKKVTQHAFVYDSHFSTKYNSKFCGATIDNISYAPTCVLEEKDRKSKAELKNMLRKFFGGNFIVEFSFKVTALTTRRQHSHFSNYFISVSLTLLGKHFLYNSDLSIPPQN